jgi:hypothetical protein
MTWQQIRVRRQKQAKVIVFYEDKLQTLAWDFMQTDIVEEDSNAELRVILDWEGGLEGENAGFVC